MKIKIKYLIIGFVLCLIVIYAFSLIRCEVLTRQHYDEFEYAYKQNTMLGDMEFFKVLEYEPCGIAKVYYVSKGYTMGTVSIFDYQDGDWKEISWGDGWSTTGNADKIVYPYFWHWIYFIF